MKSKLIILVAVAAVLIFLAAPRYTHRMIRDGQIPVMQDAHVLGLALFSYANDNNGKYPQGNSSTEIFQKLLDGGYISDPSIFYFRMTGKTPSHDKKLKPENVSWDVTDAVTSDDSDDLPIVFLTGYKIDYATGGKAHPLKNAAIPEGIAAFYKSNSTEFIVAKVDGIPLIDPTFDPKGKTYRQLTPDGPLP